MQIVSSATLDRLHRLDTPTICNVIELFDVRPRTAGYMDARIQASFPDLGPMVGFASTATFRSSAVARAGDGYASLEDQVARFAELPGPAVVVFQDLDMPAVAATFGEVMCTIYQAFGATGLITSGAGRDLDQVRALGFPVFTGGTICSHGYNRILDLHVPVQVGGIMVVPGELLHGDRNGVTTIPLDIAAEVADVGPEYIAAEQVVFEAMRGGATNHTALREARQELAARLARLRARVSRQRAN